MLYRMTYKIFITVLLLFFSFSVSAHPPKMMQTTLHDIYKTHRLTLFCEQAFDETGKLSPSHCKTCPSTPLQIHWMPIIPLTTLASSLPCYHQKQCFNKKGKTFGGVRCCQKIDPYFVKMSTDLRNYVPENPLLIKLRKNYHFETAMPLSKSGCHFYVDPQKKSVSPAPSARGLIARTYLYFHQRYQLPLTDEEKKMFIQWHENYPLSEWETKREELIVTLQNNRNPYTFKNR